MFPENHNNSESIKDVFSIIFIGFIVLALIKLTLF